MKGKGNLQDPEKDGMTIRMTKDLSVYNGFRWLRKDQHQILVNTVMNLQIQ
jgi:hypothetical protein